MLLSPSALAQKCGYKEILQPVLDDILTLETTGIEIKLGGQEHTFLGTVSMVVAHNLAAHALEGFYCNFSTVARFCRFCNCTRDQLHGDIEFSNFIERTQVGYNNNITDTKTYPEMSSLYGIKQRSCLNSLKYFHVVDGLPPHIAHDNFEGVAIDIICNIITGLVSEDKLFSIDFLNGKIASFEYSRIDKKNKPQPLKIISPSNFKIKETACEMWNLIRLPPLILGLHVPERNSYWDLFINIVQLVEKLCSLSFTSTELVLIAEHIQLFFSNYVLLFDDVKLKPKAHFIFHYPHMNERFGPLVKTLRFEAKSGYFKGLYSNNKNQKNICQYLAKRHQFMMYLHYSKENLITYYDLIGTKMSEVPVEILDYWEKNLITNSFSLKDTDILCKLSSVIFDGQQFKSGVVIVTGFARDDYAFGIIDYVLSFEGGIYFLYENLENVNYNNYFNAH